ncbi:glycosyltransferase family 4 protein [Negadavirga shengliensis]|uniref:Glycosyltransferase family 4 protein n=1 Tax=Negadavirga shengliensis TaxID=1389218 RepID=A0ABV9T2G5_9BACT
MKDLPLNILYVTNMYPAPEHPVDGIFIQEQIKDISELLPIKHEVFLIDSVYRGKKEYIKSLFRIPRKIKSGKYDLIHIHYGLSGLFLLLFRPKTKVFLTLHGSDIQKREKNGWQVWLTKKILHKADKVFVQNQAMKDLVLPFNPKVEVLTCGINSDFFKPVNGFKKTPHTKLVVFPSSPSREVKNFPLFTEVLKRANEASTCKIEHACVDNLDRDEVRTLLNKADCLLMTSKTEGSPQVIKEALSCNLPVVSVPVGDVAEITDGIPNCYVAASHNPTELSDLLVKALVRKPDNIRSSFLSKTKYNHKSIAQKLASHYSALHPGNSRVPFAKPEPILMPVNSGESLSQNIKF